MNNFKGSGKVVDIAAPEDATSGEFLIAGGVHGVAGITKLSGETVPLHREGIFTLPKATGTAWTAGDRLFWNVSGKKFTKDTTDRPIGAVAALDAASGDATGDVLLRAEGGLRYVGGQHTTVTASDTKATGLTTVVAAGGSLDSDPVDDPFMVSVSIGDQAGAPAAGSIYIKTWKNTGGTDPTPGAATTFSKKVNWWALGV